MDYSTSFHSRRMKNRGRRLLDKALLFACLAAAAIVAWANELASIYLALPAVQVLLVIACIYLGRFIENTKHLHRKEKEYVPTSMPDLRS